MLVATLPRLAQADVRQDGVDTDDPETRAEAPDRPRDMPLARLPEPPTLRLPPPRPEALKAIDDLLARVVSDDPVVRDRAARSLLEAKSDWVSGIARRIDELAERADKTAQKALLAKMRDKTRDRLEKLDPDFEKTPDYLLVALEHADPESEDWKGLTQLLSLRRMLNAVGTTEAVREIIRIYVRFGEYMRIDCQRGLMDLGDRAVAGLIEARRHPAKKIVKWAERRLYLRKKDSAHEAVRTDDPRALADILVALGRERDPDSTRLLISFAGTEQPMVRTAARQAIVLLGEVGSWQLRDAYLDTTGKQPPRDWTWKRTARELFTEFDRLRMEKVYLLFQEGKEAEQNKNWETMRKHYDEVLSLNPQFEQRTAMAGGYMAHAKVKQDSAPQEAMVSLRRVERIAEDEELQKAAESRRLLLEAKILKEQGFIDRALLERAAKLDPRNLQRATEVLSPSNSEKAWGATRRYAIGFAVALVALTGVAWILLSTWFRRRRSLTATARESHEG